MKTELKTVLAVLAAVASSFASSNAQAATYIIDSTQSSITVSGLALGFIPIVGQSPGANVAVIEGQLDVNTAGGSVNFVSSYADAVEKPGPFNPGVVSGDPPVIGPNGPADIALYLGNYSTGRLTIRDFIVSITGSSTLVGDNFDLNTLLLTVTSGSLDYNIPFASLIGHLDIGGQAANPEDGSGSLVAGVLTIPIDVAIEFEVLEGDPPGMAVVNLQGQIVANLVPEPASIAMLGIGAIGLVAIGRRRFRRG